MVGDKSDNIPGIKGIGKISATYLLKQHESISNILDDFEDVKINFRKLLQKELRNIATFQLLTRLKIINNFNWKLSNCEIKKIAPQSGAIEQELGINVNLV